MLRYAAPVMMLLVANIFMTFAWYGHLKFKASPIWVVVIISWFIAFFEYCIQVPANRIGHSVYNLAELKTIQEAITLFVFIFFSILYFKEEIKWNYIAGFALMIAAVFLVFYKK